MESSKWQKNQALILLAGGHIKKQILEHATVFLHNMWPLLRTQLWLSLFWIGSQNVEKHVKKAFLKYFC